jgi:hypothetical protein
MLSLKSFWPPLKKNDYQIVDLVDPGTPHSTRRLFEDFIFELPKSSPNDHRLRNYINLHEQLDKYECFTLLLHREKIVGFSGMHSYRRHPDHSRVLSRLYYHPSIRTSHLRGRTLPSLATCMMLPKQMQVAKKLGKTCVFMSMEGIQRNQFCHKLARAISELQNRPWQVPSEMYYTLDVQNGEDLKMSPDVWQNIIYCSLDQKTHPQLPNMSRSDWTQKFDC